MLRESDEGAAGCGPGPQRRWRPRLAHASGVGGEGPPDKYSSMIAGTRLFFVMAGQVGRAGRKGREPLLLPLLHVLHLQAEGGEAGQEVGHLIHLLSGACHLEASAQVVQPVPLLVPPQALQVLPQHLDDLLHL